MVVSETEWVGMWWMGGPSSQRVVGSLTHQQCLGECASTIVKTESVSKEARDMDF